MAYGVIYLLTDITNGMPYVGQTVNLKRRIAQHKIGDQYVDRAIQKHGWENFTVEVLEECETPEQLDEREIFWIVECNSKSPNGYNFTDGGENRNDQNGEKNPFYGKHHTEETKALLSAKQLEIAKRGEDHYFFGQHHTEEAKVQLSISHRGETPYQNLINEMDKRKMTYTVLANFMGLSQSSISAKMLDLQQFMQKDVDKLVEFFGLPAEYLFERADGLPLILTSRGGEKNPFFGKHHTEENRMKFSEMNRGESPYKNLLNEMDKRQISYVNLAELLNVSQPNISRKMTGVRNFTAKDIVKLIEIFGLPAEYLMARDDGIIATTSNRGKTPFKNLAKELQKQNITYAELGKLLGLCHQSISEKMSGKKNFTDVQWKKLSEILGKPVEYLMQRDDS